MIESLILQLEFAYAQHEITNSIQTNLVTTKMFDVFKLSERKILRSRIENYSLIKKMKECIVKLKVNLKSLISANRRVDVIKLLYQYKHLNSDNLTNLFVIDLIIHRVTMKSEIKSHSINQKR
jgi:hypothetical protein